MKERPVLFSGPMVRAILDGQKTQTRRIAKKWPQSIECPYGEFRDRLWVREKWAPCNSNYIQDVATATYACFPDGSQKYKNGNYFPWNKPVDETKWPLDWKWKPSIHMPRWASRITLEITGVRIERLQDIGESDAQAEGVEWPSPDSGVNGKTYPTCIDAYEVLWNAINGPESWAANPWVWVIGFKKV